MSEHEVEVFLDPVIPEVEATTGSGQSDNDGSVTGETDLVELLESESRVLDSRLEFLKGGSELPQFLLRHLFQLGALVRFSFAAGS